jgi:hypothetical protein
MSIADIEATAEWAELLKLPQPTPLDYLRHQLDRFPAQEG